MNKKNAAVLWSGGKDSALAFYQAKQLGYNVGGLVTFAPPQPKFLAHPLALLKYQAKALDLPHQIVEIKEPFKKSYEEAISSLKNEQGIDTLITGDISEVDGQPNWIRECSRSSGVDVLTPLWGADREELINKLFSSGFKVIFSAVKKPWFTEEWVGQELNQDALKKLRTTGADISGEQGEYHTMVIDGPLFRQKINIKNFKKRIKDELMYVDIKEVVYE